MKLLFVRHARAVPALEYEGDDLSRPLKKKGMIRATKAFKGLRALYPGLERIFTSRALRAVETAKLLAAVYPDLGIEEVDLLNPGAELPEFQRFLQSISGVYRTVAIVGHEPDFSEIISGLIHTDAEEPPHMGLEVKKASCIELESWDSPRWVLEAILPPRVLRRLGQ